MSKITGIVKWFNTTKGYGFIKPDNGGNDVFVHISTIQKCKLGSINEGQKVLYSTGIRNGKEFVDSLEISAS